MKDPAKISDFLERILPASARTAGAKEFNVLFQEWRWIAGEKLAGHSAVKTLDQGTLVVDVDHPGWIQLFQFDENKILQRAQGKFPQLKINRIRVRLVESLVNSPDWFHAEPRESKPLEEKANPELLKMLEGLKKSLDERKKEEN